MRLVITGFLLGACGWSTAAAQTAAAGAPHEIRVAAAHIAVTNDVSRNLAALERAVRYAASEKADILLTPEGALSGYITDFDAERTAAALERISALARKFGIALALGTCFLEPDDAKR